MDPPAPRLPALFDERARPDFREAYGILARRSTGLDVAVRQIRIAGLDLRPGEVRGLERIRLVVAEVNGIAYRADAEVVLAQPDRAPGLLHLLDLLERGRVEIRSAPLAGWTPDFSIFHGRDGRARALVGRHWFVRPYPHRGPALTSLQRRDAARLLRSRFEELWRHAHEIGPQVAGLLRRARARGGANPPNPLSRKEKPGPLRPADPP